MPTDKPRFTIVVTDELYDKINDFRFEKKFKSQSKAINELIMIGLNSLLNEDFDIGPNFSKQEINIIEKYRDLDEHGKKMVDFVLEEEHKHCQGKQRIIDPIDQDADEFLKEIHKKESETNARSHA
ncbi:hypothetical protein D3Z38_11795 [Clostridiales bacterium]|nr:hypothetical protein [Clostridiales bacterium]